MVFKNNTFSSLFFFLIKCSNDSLSGRDIDVWTFAAPMVRIAPVILHSETNSSKWIQLK